MSISSLSHTEIVLSFYQRVLGQRDTEWAKQIIAPDYIQHNPQVPTGQAGVLGAIEYLKQFPVQAPTEPPIKRMIVEGNFVAVHLLVEMGPSRLVVLDLFRLENGLIQEHWDAIQPEVETLSGHGMLGGGTKAPNSYSKEKAKAQVSKFYRSVMMDRQLDRIPALVSRDFVQHHPGLAEGTVGLAQSQTVYQPMQVHRLIAEDNLVLVQASGQQQGAEYVFYDLFRLDGEQIVEQWNVSQAIPAEMAHENGMI